MEKTVDFIAYNIDSLNNNVLLEIIYGIDDYVVNGYYTAENGIEKIVKSKIYYSNSNGPYFKRYNKKLYLDEYIKI